MSGFTGAGLGPGEQTPPWATGEDVRLGEGEEHACGHGHAALSFLWGVEWMVGLESRPESQGRELWACVQ